jgi:hypothetical protein
MLCCLFAALLTGNLAAAGRIAAGLVRRPTAGKAMVLAGLGVAGFALAPAAVAHVGHYAARAEAHQRSILEEILAQPLCSGAVSHEAAASQNRNAS